MLTQPLIFFDLAAAPRRPKTLIVFSKNPWCCLGIRRRPNWSARQEDAERTLKPQTNQDNSHKKTDCQARVNEIRCPIVGRTANGRQSRATTSRVPESRVTTPRDGTIFATEEEHPSTIPSPRTSSSQCGGVMRADTTACYKNGGDRSSCSGHMLAT